MDLNNLTLDDLLNQIKSDSSYQEPDNVKPAKAPEQAAPKAAQNTDLSNFFSTEAAEEVFGEPSKPEEIEEQQASAQEPLPEEEPLQEPDSSSAHAAEALGNSLSEDFSKLFIAPEEIEATLAAAFEFKPAEDAFDPDSESKMDFGFLSFEPEDDETEEESAEPASFYTAPKPEITQSLDIIEDPDFDPLNFFEPRAVSISSPSAEAADSRAPQPAEHAPSAQPEESSADESFKIFGNVNIDSDVSQYFPVVTDDADEQNAEAVHAEEKTIVIEQLIDKTAVFERPGILTGKSMFEKTADLSAVPSIISAEDALKDKYLANQKTFIRTGAIPIISAQSQQSIHREPDDGQMILPGFEPQEEPVAHVDESTVEDELRRTRSKKVDSFKLEGVAPEKPRFDEETVNMFTENAQPKHKRFSKTKTRTRLNRQSVEYRKPNDKQQVAGFIRSKKLAAFIALIISGICTAALLITTAIPTVAQTLDNSSSAIPVTAVIALALLAISFIASLPCCAAGIGCFFNGSGKPNAQTPALFAAFSAILQSAIILIFDSGSDLPLFAPAGAFALCLTAAGKWISYKRIAANFEFIASKNKNELNTVKAIENAVDANKIGKNVVMGEAGILYSGKTKFVSNFLAYSMASDAADDLCVKLVPIVAAASALIGVVAGITTKNAVCGLSLFAGAMCMGAPASAIIAASMPLSRTNKKLRQNGGIITGYAGAFDYESTNAVALDASDIFPGDCCNIHGMKTFYGVRMDDAILTAASMLITSGGPISSLFNEVVMGRKELLMNVEDMAYEDRLGLSGWIRGRRVFVGNRKLLENHNIEIPISVDEAKYRHDGRRVIYLADAGKIAAIFVVSYGTDKATAEYLRRIESNGINLLIRSTDSNITEEFVANAFGLPLNSVKIVKPNAAEILKSYADDVSSKDDAKLVHCGKASSFLQCINSANILCWAAGVITTQQTFCCAAGLLLLAGMVLFSGAASVTALQICICQLVWLGIGIIVPMINKE